MHKKNDAPQRYHSQDWCCALWIQSLGMRALPPAPQDIKPLPLASAQAMPPAHPRAAAER